MSNSVKVNGSEQVRTLWPVKFCSTVGVNLFSLTCELLWGNKISSNQLNNIGINTPSVNIVFDRQIKTRQQQPHSREMSTTFMLN